MHPLNPPATDLVYNIKNMYMLQSEIVFGPTSFLDIYNEKNDANFCISLDCARAKTFALRPSAKKMNSAKNSRKPPEKRAKMAFRGLEFNIK